MEYIWSENLDLGFKVNRLYPGRELATPQTLGVGPNVDTLYGFAWLDLTKGPQVIQVPAIPDRYYSFQLIDMWSNPFAYIGTRATGTGAGAYALTPPGWQGTLPSGVQSISAPTKRVFVLTRTLVNSPSDLDAAVAVEASYRNGPLSAYPNGLSAPIFNNLQSQQLAPNLPSYGIVFPQGQLPPVSAFWSLILYNSSFQLVANPINRYEVASHTPGLIFRSDGSLSITVSNTQPTDPTTNWLPAPAGAFSLTLRTYIPQAPILNQTWQPPALQLAPA